MKKIILVLAALALVAGVATAEDLPLVSVSGSGTVEWGFSGQLIDNTGSFLDAAKPDGDFYTSQSGSLTGTAAPSFTFKSSVADAEGNVIVEAAAAAITPAYAYGIDAAATFDYIKFPNVIPGILGITLDNAGTLSAGSNCPKSSTVSNEKILLTLTPIEQLSATIGLVVKGDNPLVTRQYDIAAGVGTAQTTGLFTWKDDGDLADGGADADDFDQSLDGVILDDATWEAGNYLTWAVSLGATFTQELNDEDSISVGFGTVLDANFNNEVYEPDYKVEGTDNTYSVFAKGATTNETDTTAATEAVVSEMWGAQVVNALTRKETHPTEFDAASTTEAKALRTNEVHGRTTIPLGLDVVVGVADLTANVDFQMVLAEGKDTYSTAFLVAMGGMPLLTGTEDDQDEKKSNHDYVDYASPMYFAADVGYALASGDMTITPSVTFKYCSDFWKWAYWDHDADAATANEWEYNGDVTRAGFVGRPMSLNAGVDVAGIAGMIDVNLSAGLSLGDGKAPTHGPLPSLTITADKNGLTETYVYDNTLAEIIDFWLVQPTKADKVEDYPPEARAAIIAAGAAIPIGAPTPDLVPDAAADGLNNMFFAAGNSAMDLPLTITAKVIDGLTISNVLTYGVDNLGVNGASAGTLYGTKLSSLNDEIDIAYDWMIGDAVGFTLFGEFIYNTTSYATEDGQKFVGLRTKDDPAAIDNRFAFAYSEATSMATFNYKAGIKCTVGL